MLQCVFVGERRFDIPAFQLIAWTLSLGMPVPAYPMLVYTISYGLSQGTHV